MRPIDADALLQEFERRQEQQISNYCDCFLNDAHELSTEWNCVEDMVENATTIEAIPIDVVAEMLAELFGEECCCNYNGIDEWLPMLCEHSETCPEPIEKNGCWKQFIKHWGNNHEIP